MNLQTALPRLGRSNRKTWLEPALCRVFRYGCLLWCLAAPLLALDPSRDISQYHQRHWGLNEGLPQSTINTMIQTREGWIWIGTQHGLARFDGVHFTIFDRNTTPALRDGFIQKLYEDQQGTLWIGTRDGGLVSYDTAGRFTLFGLKDGLLESNILSLIEDGEGRLLVGTRRGLFQKTESGFRDLSRLHPLLAAPIRCLLLDNEGLVWVGTEQGLLRLSGNRPEVFFDQWQLRDREIHALTLTQDGVVFISSEGYGLTRYAHDRFEGFPFGLERGGIRIQAMAEDHDGNLWLGTERRGLMRFQMGRYVAGESDHPLSEKEIFTIMEDREQSLWIGSRNGLDQLRDGSFYRISKAQGLSENLVWSIYEDHEGAVWAGTDGGGLNRIQEGTTTYFNKTDGMPDDGVMTVIGDGKGTIWAGTRGGLAQVKDGQIRSFTTDDGLCGNFIIALLMDRAGRLWIGSRRSGLSIYHRGQFRNLTVKDGLPSNIIRCFLQDHSGVMWVGTDNGLVRIDEDDIRIFGVADGLSNTFVRSLHQDKEGNLYIGTYAGLNRYDGRNIRNVGLKDGLFSNVIFFIDEDRRGNLWLSSQEGFGVVSKLELNRFLDGRRSDLPSRVFGSRGDRERVECNGGVRPAGVFLKNGTLMLPALEGIVVVNPAKASQSLFSPKPLLTDALVDGEPFAFDKQNTVPRETEKIEFHFTTLSFNRPEKMTFAVKLDGYNRDWDVIGNSRAYHYTNLAPGHYSFRVRSANSDGVWSEDQLLVPFNITPNYYETPLFYFLIALALALSIYLFVRYRVRKVELRKVQLEGLVNARTQALERTNQELREAQDRLIRAAHFAGMAEIATNVLHNVGNALNSVNVSVGMVEDQTKKLRSESLARLGDLLETHADALPSHLKPGVPSDKVVSALQKLIRGTEKTKIDILREIDTLNERVQHINHIIRDQQRHAELGGLFEKASLTDLVMEAAQIQKGRLESNDVKMEMEFLVSAQIRVQKSKFVQVLVNLIKNAYEATLELPPDHRHVHILVSRKDPETVRIEIHDNGVGIDPDHLTRVFHQGYTTKQDGKGFGLHFCGNVVSEMKGHIHVRSAGRGQGATFVIELPDADAVPEQS